MTQTEERGGADAVRQLADDLLDAMLDASPVTATLFGIRDRDTLLPDLSAEAQATFERRYRDLASRAADLDVSDGGPDDRVTVEVVRHVAASSADRAAMGLEALTVTDFFVAPAAGLLSELPFLTLEQPEHAAAYLERLRAVPTFLDAVADRNRAAVSEGRVPVAHLVARAADHIDRYLAAPEHDPARVPAPPAGWDGAASFAEERDRVLADVVRPAYARYRDALRADVLPAGRPQDRPGLGWLPRGEEDYATLVRYHTTTDADPAALHRTGLDLIERLAGEYAEIGARALGTGSVGEVLDRMREDPALRFGTEEEILEAARATIRRAESVASSWFGRLPSTRCVVAPFPPNEAPQSPGAVYMPGTPDGSRRGTYLVNTYLPAERTRYDAESTAYHEAVPGHHFQITLAQELTHLPLLRRLLPVTAFEEGWALYSERLADEMGLYSDETARLGMLSGDSMRAARLVVDTGLHVMGWSRARAVEYLATATPMVRQDIEVEIDRYIADPGQALAYMVGRLEISRLRAETAARLGDRFDLRGFHDLVLGGGSLPLATLAGVVGRWDGGTTSSAAAR